jgi:putative FmdB family regulatory protein
MPIFEFTCNTCNTGRKFSALVGVVATATPPVCPKCGGTDLKKAVSRFARVRSEDDALEALADRADNADLDDPATMRRFMKEMAGEMGEDMDGEDIEQMMEEAMEEEAGGAGDGGPEGGGAGDDL